MAGRGRYTSGFPLQEVRVRNWPAGKAAALKRAIALLQGQLNQTMAAQVDQGGKRVFNSRVPLVVNVVVRAGFKNFNLTFDEAKGIEDLLFYEIQKDSTSAFANPTTFTIPQTTLTIPTSVEHERVFFRIRCVNSKFEVGPWSSTTAATGSSNFRIAITRTDRIVVSIPFANLDTWTDITSVSYTPAAASVCLNVHAGAYTPIAELNALLTQNNISGVQFRVLRNGAVVSNYGDMYAVNASKYITQAEDTIEVGTEDVQICTIVLPFETFTGQESVVTYTLQAKVTSDISSRNVSNGSVGTEPTFIIVDFFDLIEVVQST